MLPNDRNYAGGRNVGEWAKLTKARTNTMVVKSYNESHDQKSVNLMGAVKLGTYLTAVVLVLNDFLE